MGIWYTIKGGTTVPEGSICAGNIFNGNYTNNIVRESETGNYNTKD
jgi:hypothetical protein